MKNNILLLLKNKSKPNLLAKLMKEDTGKLDERANNFDEISQKYLLASLMKEEHLQLSVFPTQAVKNLVNLKLDQLLSVSMLQSVTMPFFVFVS